MRIRVLLLSLAGLCPVVSAQEILWQRLGERDVLFLDGATLVLDDIDGDGYEDVVQHAEITNVSGTALLTLSGRDGRVLRTYLTQQRYLYTALVAAGDVDGDGLRDYAVRTYFAQTGAPNVVEVRSGRDEHVIWSVIGPFSDDFGDRIAGDLDLNGDGRPDLLVSALREGGLNGGAVHAYDHRGVHLYRIAIKVGSVAALGGDLDGDGCDDFILGHLDPGVRGAATVYSGRSGQPIVSGYGELFGDGLGLGSVSGVGDIDGDGVVDFAGASAGSFGQANLLRVFSGATGQPIYSIRKPNGVDFGRFLLSADLDRDGVRDLLVGSGELASNGTSGGSIWWYSLRNGDLVTTIYPPGLPTKLTYFAYYGAIGSPRPGDLFPVFTAPDRIGDGGSFAGLGRAILFRAAPAGVVGRGITCNGSLPRAPRIGLRDLGTGGFRLHLSAAPPAATAVLMLGSSHPPWRTQPIEIDMNRLGFLGCTLQVPIELALPVVTGTNGIDAGYAFFDVPLPLNQGRGFALHAQWLVLGAGAQAPGALSDALTTQH